MNIITFNVKGLDCPAEEGLIRKQLDKLKGIQELECNFINQEVTIKHTLEDYTLIEESIRSLGMEVSIKNKMVTEKSLDKPNYLKKWLPIIAGGIFALMAEIWSLIHQNEDLLIVASCSLLAIALSGKQTFLKGINAIRTFTLNINFLMMIAITGALIIREWPEAAMVTVLFAIAELIESYSLDKARHAIKSLMEVAPETATVKTSENTWRIMHVNNIKIGDVILVKPGDRIPLDGIIIKGQSAVNQAPVTGESLPVDKNIEDVVYAGTLNINGAFEFRVTAFANQTLLSKIIHKIEQAQAERAPTQRFIDQFAKYYTPIMVIIALLIALLPPLLFSASFSFWFYKALVLLVIACPCALVISTPVTIVSGLAAAAKHGILIKGGTYLENGYKLKAIAFDKTGTLTEGKPIITDILALEKDKEIDGLRLAASLNHYSEHPIAQAITKKWKENNIDQSLYQTDNFQAIPGRGTTGIINGQKYFIGNHQLAEENKVCSAKIEELLEKLEQEGKTTIVLSTDSKALYIFAVADTLRLSSKRAINALHELGITTAMLTGDNKLTANAIAKVVGIDNVKANLLPTAKLEAIDMLITQYKHVGMVGDGINDSPALAKATIGFAMGNTGTDTALEAADVAIMEDNLNKLPLFIKLSHFTSNVLKQNITISIATKSIFFILALTGYSTLWMAVFADMGASLIVVINGLRLLKYSPKLN